MCATTCILCATHIQQHVYANLYNICIDVDQHVYNNKSTTSCVQQHVYNNKCRTTKIQQHKYNNLVQQTHKQRNVYNKTIQRHRYNQYTTTHLQTCI